MNLFPLPFYSLKGCTKSIRMYKGQDLTAFEPARYTHLKLSGFDIRGGFPRSLDLKDCVGKTHPGSSSKSYFFCESNSKLEF